MNLINIVMKSIMNFRLSINPVLSFHLLEMLKESLKLRYKS